MFSLEVWKCTFILLIVHCHTVLCFYNYYMMERCPKNLLKMEDHGISAGRLRLVQENKEYGEDMLCLMSIRAPEDHQLMVHFLSLEIEGFVSEGCQTDYLMLFDGPTDHSPIIETATKIKQYTSVGEAPISHLNAIKRVALKRMTDAEIRRRSYEMLLEETPDRHKLCGTLTPRATFATTGPVVTIKFFSDSSRSFRGFDLIFTAFHTGLCDTGEFSCKNGRCINSSLHCNDYNNCGDDSDWCGPNTSIVIFIVIICLSILILLVTSVFRCSCKEKVKRFTKSTASCPEEDVQEEGGDIRVASYKGYPRRRSSSSQESPEEPQQEPLLHDSTSSV